MQQNSLTLQSKQNPLTFPDFPESGNPVITHVGKLSSPLQVSKLKNEKWFIAYSSSMLDCT